MVGSTLTSQITPLLLCAVLHKDTAEFQSITKLTQSAYAVFFFSQEETDVLVQEVQNHQERIYGSGIKQSLWPFKKCSPMRFNDMKASQNKMAIKWRDSFGDRHPAARTSLGCDSRSSCIFFRVWKVLKR